MKNSIWFKRKSYGWGWTPANALGWVVTVFYVMSLSLYPIVARYFGLPFESETFWFVSGVVTSAFVGLCWWKGESPGWRWGKTSDFD